MRLLLVAALLLLAAAPARADTAAVTSSAPAKERPRAGFGQDEGEDLREPRIRFEGSWLGAVMASTFRYGKSGRSNNLDPQADLDVPRWSMGERASLALKVFDWYGMGGSYLRLAAEGPTRPARTDVRIGIPTREIPEGAPASASVELQQLTLDLRLFLVDNAEFRAECYCGLGWVSYRLGIHPAAPFALPGGGTSMAVSRSTEAYFTPVLGIFLVWNIHPRFGLYVDTILNYFSWSKPGSSAGLTRAGVRVRIVSGFEAVVGILVVSGGVYDLRDAFGSRASGHEFKQSSWVAGGPELGVSYTF